MPKVPSPRRVEREMSRLDQLYAELGDKFDLSVVESESGALELIDQYVEMILAAEALAEMAKARADKLKANAGKLREIVVQIIEQKLPPETHSLSRPLYTASLGYSQSVVVTDENVLPIELFAMSPDRRAIAKALHQGDVPGATLSNLKPKLTIRPTRPSQDEEAPNE